MNKSTFDKYSSIGQAGLWLLLFLILLTAEVPYTGLVNAVLYAFNFVAFQAILVYVHYRWVLPLLIRWKKFIYFPLAVVLVVLFNALSGVSDSLLIPYTDPAYGTDTGWEEVMYILPLSVLILIATSCYYFIEKGYQSIQNEGALVSEKLQAELNFLKSQINPHFLFNTLNNIYSYVQTGHRNAAPMLERLSSILRFMVYDCAEDRVELVKEMQAVEDLLEVHKMKNTDQENITLTLEGIKRYHLIVPLIVVNLVENACKHSDVITNQEGFIHVKLQVDDHDYGFLAISNSVRKIAPERYKDGGVGLANVIKRLELQYGNAYSIDQKLEHNSYHLKLNIPLERKH
ncbi:MAG: histidine kinase [Bacteroidota bacterium]